MLSYKLIPPSILSVSLSICFAFLAALSGIAQGLAYRTIDLKDGLPTNCVYKVGQGKDGFMWFFTNKGVSRYDGSSIKNFDLSTGLPGFRIIGISHDLSGRIWFSYGNSDLAYADNGEIHQYRYNQLIKDSIHQSTVTNFAFDTLGTLWIGFRNSNHASCIASISTDGIWKWYDTHYHNCTIYSKKIGTYWVQGTHAPIHANDRMGDMEGYQPSMLIDDGKRLRSFVLPKLDGMRYYNVAGKEYVLANEHGIYKVIYDSLIRIYKGNIPAQFLQLDNESNIYLKSADKVLLRFDSTGISSNPEFLFQDKLATWATQDRDGNYWVSSFRDGVYFIPSWSIKIYEHPGHVPKGYMRGLTYYSDTLIIPYRDGTICMAKPSGDSLITNALKCGHTIFSMGISQTEIPAFCFFGSGPRFYLEKGRFPFVKNTGQAISCGNGKVLIGRQKAIVLGDLKNGTMGNAWISKKKLYSIFPLSHQHHLFSNIDGVVKLDTGWQTFLSELDPRLGSPVFHFQLLSEDWIAMASFDQGVLIYKGEQVIQIDTSQGLLSNSCNKLLVDGNRLWVASDKGINELTLDIREDGIDLIASKAYGYYHGLPMKDVEHFTVDSQYIWITDNANLYRLPKKLGSSGRGSVASRTYIHKLSAAKESYHSTEKPSILYGSGSIEISFSNICYLDPKGISYRYRLANDEDWRITNNPVVVYDKLPPGNYEFQVKAIHEIAETRSNIASSSFRIAPLFWQTSWFMAVLIFTGVVLAYLLFSTRVRTIKRREKLVQMAMSYRDQALRAQMNPHFIYNTLNSIQRRILEENSEISSQHLSKFSRLIRMVFDHSSHNYIPLEEDLNALAIYVELEKLRFGDKVHFSQNIETGIDTSQILVPPMLLQPLVENAIIHGVLPGQQNGSIELTISLHHNLLKFCIHDSGHGTDEEAFKAKNRRSGSQITFDRIDQFNKEHGVTKEVSISSQQGKGTSICFFLAIKKIS